METKKGRKKAKKPPSPKEPPAELTKKDYIQRGVVILVIAAILATALYLTQYL
ncbi:MAG: hypothetical protein RI842_08675 [Schleiferiaceae bacterium]|jgi:hypothetical protein|nr:hypothetical protein [Schleiferiaceae bacterium]MDR9442780.1 hypothetical protein [Schleiferiaceae bacterium]